MEQYASIGKLLLKRAVGLQRNYKNIEHKTVSKLDEKASGCFACPNYSLKKVYEKRPESKEYQDACLVCEQCAGRVYKEVQTEVVKYVNENNRYADKQGRYAKTLKVNGIKLLLVLHMMHPNRYGHIFELPVAKLKRILNCDRKTICANLAKLKLYGYIDYVNEHGVLNVVLKGFEDYFKPAKEGGRGFMTFSRSLVEALLFVKTYKELLRGLPAYYKPNHVKKGLLENMDNPIFTLKVEEKVSFQLNADYDAKKMKEQLIRESKTTLMDYIDQLNEKFVKINQGILRPEDCLPEIFCKTEGVPNYIPFTISKNTYGDLARMCWQFSIYEIMDTLNFVYMNYTLKHTPIENLAGLVRTLLPEVEEMNRMSQLVA